MQIPFEIRIFSVSGDPQGIRQISKTNWSGIGVAFPREAFSELKGHDFIRAYMERAGVYMLIGEMSEQTIYIGEADPIRDRLKQHLSRVDWQWAVFFVDALHGLGKTEVQHLEAELLNIAHKCKTSLITNKNRPTHPNMSPAARAAVSVFLGEILSIVPLIGIRAFREVESYLDTEGDVTPITGFDTIVVPAYEEGFKETFLDENRWYAIKIQAKLIPQIKYIAAYVTAPVSAITHIAEIDKIEPYEEGQDASESSGKAVKYIVTFKGSAQKIGPIPLADGGITVVPRSPRYSKRQTLLSAKRMADVWAH